MEKGLLNLIDFLDDVVCFISAEDFGVKYINRAAEEVLGYTPKDFLDDSQLFVRIIHPEDREFVLTTFKNLLNDKRCDIEFRVISPKKEIVWIRARGKLGYVSSDPKPCIFCVLRDISKRKEEQEELKYQVEFQRLVSHISQKFVNIGPDNLEKKILYCLKHLCCFARVERCYLFKFSCKNELLESIYEWQQKGSEPVIMKDLNCSLWEFKWILSRLKNAEFLNISDISLLPPEASKEKEYMGAHGVRSLLIFPLMCSEKLLGFIGFGAAEAGKFWGEREIALLEAVSKIISIALNRLQMMMELKASKERFKTIFEASPIPIVVYSPEGHVEMWNPAAEKTYGWKEEEVLGKFNPTVPEDQRENFLEILKAVAGGETFKGIEVLRKRRDGSLLWIRASVAPIYYDHGSSIGIISLGEDITYRKKMEEALRESEKKFRLLAENAQDLIFRLSLKPRKKYEYVSPSAKVITGYDPDEFYGDPDIDLRLVHPEDRDIYDGESFDKVMELRWRRKDGRNIWVEKHNTLIYDEEGKLAAVEGIVRDITKRKELELKLEYYSTHDGLTGLYNRAFFEEEMARLRNERLKGLGIVVIDVDGLKIINDSMGHAVGDELLKTAADILKAAFRKGDVVARVGGDEFAVLLPNVKEEDLKKICKRVENLIDEFNERNSGLPLSITLGYGVEYGEKIDPDELFKKADNDMYRKKLFRSRSAKSAAVNALLKIMEARDYYVEGHGERILRLVSEMAKKLNLSEGRTADLMLFAQFHDIGKVGIPDRILLKNGKLTPEEYEEMKRHSEIGYWIALSYPELAPIADFILKHHEWWNGEGYLLGIKGEEIPLECRILSIADAYDAMTNDRPYRNGKSHGEAVSELRRLAGRQFDPELVEIFLGVVEEMRSKEQS